MSYRGNNINNFNNSNKFSSIYQNTQPDNDNLIKNINLYDNNEIPEIITQTLKIK